MTVQRTRGAHRRGAAGSALARTLRGTSSRKAAAAIIALAFVPLLSACAGPGYELPASYTNNPVPEARYDPGPEGAPFVEVVVNLGTGGTGDVSGFPTADLSNCPSVADIPSEIRRSGTVTWTRRAQNEIVLEGDGWTASMWPDSGKWSSDWTTLVYPICSGDTSYDNVMYLTRIAP